MTIKKKPRPVPTWDDYFMAMCFIVASRSKDPSTQHGALVVDEKHRIQGTGYNGTPALIADNDIDWSRPDAASTDPLKRAGKYPFIVHAEQNALDNCHGYPNVLHNSVIYVTGPPCSECTKRIASKAIKKIIFGPQSSLMVNADDWQVTKELCKMAHITLERYAGNINWLRDRLEWMTENMQEVFSPQTPLPL
jgi:dCMP deaminase